MFSGIVEKTTNYQEIKKEKGGIRISFKITNGFKVKEGESVNVDGVCSTVEKVKKGIFSFFYMPETLKKTTLSKISKVHTFNLERPLRLGSLVSGHLVAGHIDTTAKVSNIKKGKGSNVIKFQISEKFTKYIIYKGSIAINGVSLTVTEVGKDFFSVSLIPYTISHTNLGQIRIGDSVNIEIDQIYKYVEKLIRGKYSLNKSAYPKNKQNSQNG